MPKLRSSQIEDGYTTFLDLLDAPSTYTGGSGKAIGVNATEDGLEFVNAGAGVSDAYQDVAEIYAQAATGSVTLSNTEWKVVTGITGNSFMPSQTGFYTFFLKSMFEEVDGGSDIKFRLGVSDGYIGASGGDVNEAGFFGPFGTGLTVAAVGAGWIKDAFHVGSIYLIANVTYSFELQSISSDFNSATIDTDDHFLLHILGPWPSTGKGGWAIYEDNLGSSQTTTSSTWRDIDPATLGGYMTPTENGKYMFLMQGIADTITLDSEAQFRLDINGDSYGGDNPEHTIWLEASVLGPGGFLTYPLVYTVDLAADTLHTIHTQFRRTSGSGTVSVGNNAVNQQLSAIGPLTEYTKVFDSFPAAASATTTGSWADMDAYFEGYFTPEQTATYCFLLRVAVAGTDATDARITFRLDIDGDAYGGGAGYEVSRTDVSSVVWHEYSLLTYKALLEADTQYLIKTQWKDNSVDTGNIDANSGFALHAFGPFNEIT
jgi:hypothetical protein